MSPSSAPFACAASASAGEGRYGNTALASDSSSSPIFAMPPPPGQIMLTAKQIADQRKEPGTTVSSQADTLRHCRNGFRQVIGGGAAAARAHGGDSQAGGPAPTAGRRAFGALQGEKPVNPPRRGPGDPATPGRPDAPVVASPLR